MTAEERRAGKRCSRPSLVRPGFRSAERPNPGHIRNFKNAIAAIDQPAGQYSHRGVRFARGCRFDGPLFVTHLTTTSNPVETKMAPIDLASLPVNETPFKFTRRDVLLYAVAEGCSFDDHKHVWERHPEFETLPTYPTVLGQKGDTFDVRPFEEIMKSNEVKLPLKIDPTLILDGGRVLEWLAPIPTSGEGKMVNKTTGVYDVGTAAIIETTSTVIINGKPVMNIIGQRFCRGAGGFGGPRAPKDPNPIDIPKNRAPDAVMEFKIPENQTLLYRLSGDTMPQHVDLELAKRNKWAKPIVMGLGTYGIVSRAIMKTWAGNQQTRMQRMAGRFAAIVYPGETLYVEMWKVREDADTVTVAYQARIKERKGADGKDLIVMSQGSAICRKKPLAANL